MEKIKLCVQCKKQPIHIKKRKLCIICYRKFRAKKGRLIRPIEHREMDFIKNYFEHNNWIYQPAIFNLGELNYTPDFYDGNRNIFIEVTGSRQAYNQNKEKYKLMSKIFPMIKLELRKPNGDLLVNKYGEMWQNQYNSTVSNS